jgi:hypothetical protein
MNPYAVESNPDVASDPLESTAVTEEPDDDNVTDGGFGVGATVSIYAVHEAEFELVRPAESSV